jgi:hypothetical protein
MKEEGTEREGGLWIIAWMSGGRNLRISSIALRSAECQATYGDYLLVHDELMLAYLVSEW